MFRKALLLCGILSSLLYIVMNIVVPMQWSGYSLAARTVSELSAIGAPTRALWVPLGLAYTALVAAFGCGVRMSARPHSPLRIAGTIMVAYGLIGLAWPPMHLREVLAAGGATLTDTMHIVFAMVTVLLMLLAMGFGAAAFTTRFRLYSVVSAVILVGCGIATSISAPRISANLPTPWIGVWERINIAVFLLWVVVLSMSILRTEAVGAEGDHRDTVAA
jgi:hypothetical protein